MRYGNGSAALTSAALMLGASTALAQIKTSGLPGCSICSVLASQPDEALGLTTLLERHARHLLGEHKLCKTPAN
jgi:hypothetical protein